MPSRRPVQPAAPAAPEDPDRAAYRDARDAYRDARDRERIAARQQDDADEQALKDRLRKEREQALAGDWSGRGRALNQLRQALRMLQDAKRKALREERDERRRRERERWPPFPDYRDWRDGAWHHTTGPLRADVPGPDRAAADADIRAYQATAAQGGGIAYWHASRRGRPDIIARGRTHRILQIDEATVHASLQLHKAQGSKSIRIGGRDPRFVEMSIRQAVRMGFRIDNPELQGQVDRERRRQLKAAAADLRERYNAMRLGEATRWHCIVSARAGGRYEYAITDTGQSRA